MKKLLLVLTLFVLTLFVNGQDKMGFGDMSDGVDSAGYGLTTTWVKPFCSCPSTVQIGTVTYNVVKIGCQCWLASNLKYTDGGAGIVSSGYYTTLYGYYYSRAAAQRISDLIPGWHLATLSDYNTLMSNVVNIGDLKSTSSWDSPNTCADNSSGFNLLGSGYWDSSYSILCNLNQQTAFILYDSGSLKIAYYNQCYIGSSSNSYWYPIRLIKD